MTRYKVLEAPGGKNTEALRAHTNTQQQQQQHTSALLGSPPGSLWSCLAPGTLQLLPAMLAQQWDDLVLPSSTICDIYAKDKGCILN